MHRRIWPTRTATPSFRVSKKGDFHVERKMYSGRDQHDRSADNVPAKAESADSATAEIALLKKQLRLMEEKEKLDRLQKQTTANSAARGQCQGESRRECQGRHQGSQSRRRQRGHPRQRANAATRRGEKNAIEFFRG